MNLHRQQPPRRFHSRDRNTVRDNPGSFHAQRNQRPHVPRARPRFAQFPAVFLRSGRLADRHLDANHRHALAGLPFDEIGANAGHRRIYQRRAAFSSRAICRRIGGPAQTSPHHGCHPGAVGSPGGRAGGPRAPPIKSRSGMCSLSAGCSASSAPSILPRVRLSLSTSSRIETICPTPSR